MGLVNVPYDSCGRQRLLFIPADRLAKTLRSRVYIGKEGSVISVGRIEVSGELQFDEFKLVNSDRDVDCSRTKARAAAISSTAALRAGQSKPGLCSLCSHGNGSDMCM